MDQAVAQMEYCQSIMEQRFGCCICLGPKFDMVSGQCQHRICVDCLYVNNSRRPCMAKCPLCGMNNSFPLSRPVIPTQVIDIQRYLGVQRCPNGCAVEMWYWEVNDHLKRCSLANHTTTRQSVNKVRSRRSHVADRGTVTTLSRTPSASANKRVTRSASQNQRHLRSHRDT